jgi:uncharacterized protein (DUF1786 family)
MPTRPPLHNTEEELLLDYRDRRRRFDLACKQVVLLNNRIADLRVRHGWAVEVNDRRFRYLKLMELTTTVGVRNRFSDYCSELADKLDRMRDELEAYGIDPMADYA